MQGNGFDVMCLIDPMEACIDDIDVCMDRWVYGCMYVWVWIPFSDFEFWFEYLYAIYMWCEAKSVNSRHKNYKYIRSIRRYPKAIMKHIHCKVRMIVKFYILNH